jgi:hypothetical protein
VVHRTAAYAQVLSAKVASHGHGGDGLFQAKVLENPERPGITREMCEGVVETAEHVVRQPNGRFAFWGRPEGRDLYLRVIVTGDRRALHNAFFDSGFTRTQRRKESEG